jgi:hypothetical protein
MDFIIDEMKSVTDEMKSVRYETKFITDVTELCHGRDDSITDEGLPRNEMNAVTEEMKPVASVISGIFRSAFTVFIFFILIFDSLFC